MTLLACSICALAATLPAENGQFAVETQEWPYQPGPREVTVYLRYPGEKLANVNEDTGLFLVLHNWNGTDASGAPDPQQVADRYNVVAISLDYLESGKQTPRVDPPYDFGYLQAIDALRALGHVHRELDAAGVPFANDRIYATGGSGGGNVTLQVNRLAPHTFACIVDMCGMARLSNDIAFNLDGGSRLDAGYSPDPESPRHLSEDEQQIRTPADLTLLKRMKAIGNAAKIVVVHGTDDDVCTFADAHDMVENMRKAELDVDAHFVDKAMLDGDVFTSTGHPLGNRTKILFQVADKYLSPDSPDMRRQNEKSDFLRDESVTYPTTNGAYTITFNDFAPTIQWAGKDQEDSKK